MVNSSLEQVIREAQRHQYGVAAFNAVNLETGQAIVRAAEMEGAPVFLQISENAGKYGLLEDLAAIGRTLRARARVPVFLHYDHAEGKDAIDKAVALGFDSVMLETGAVDWNTLPHAIAAAHEKNVHVEIEFETTAKGEASSTHLELDEILQRIEESFCDLAATNLGTEHKQLDKGQALDLSRLRALAERTTVPLVLHGSSGVSNADLVKAVKGGIVKVNIATDLYVHFTRAVRNGLRDENIVDPRFYLGPARDAMTSRARELIRLLRSA